MLTLSIHSNQQVEMIDITRQVAEAVGNSGVYDGLVVVFVPHTTAGVTINENADPDVTHDLVMELNKIVPFADGYRHREGNSAAHLKASLVGASETLILRNGALQLGTWQGIFFCEFDGPRRRQLQLKVIAG
jgi:secondary thiamine-phosphate synthase enzyme